MTVNLPGVVLAQMRAQADALMTDTCTLYQRTNTVDEYGALVEAAEVVASDIACRVITYRAPESQGETVAYREAQIDRYRLVCPAGTALGADQWIVLGSTGETWHIVDVLTDRTSEVDTQALIARVNE